MLQPLLPDDARNRGPESTAEPPVVVPPVIVRADAADGQPPALDLQRASKPISREPASWLPTRLQRAAAALVTAGLLAQFLVYAGRQTEGPSSAPDAGRLTPPRFLVDVNRAPWPELAVLPGVGETLARALVADRQANGPYRSTDDLQRLRGVGPATIERWRPYLAPFE